MINPATPQDKHSNHVLKTAVSNEMGEVKTCMENLIEIFTTCAENLNKFKNENDKSLEAIQNSITANKTEINKTNNMVAILNSNFNLLDTKFTQKIREQYNCITNETYGKISELRKSIMDLKEEFSKNTNEAKTYQTLTTVNWPTGYRDNFMQQQ